MKTLGLIWFILFLVTTFVYIHFEGCTNMTICSLGITILSYLIYLGGKLDEIDKKK